MMLFPLCEEESAICLIKPLPAEQKQEQDFGVIITSTINEITRTMKLLKPTNLLF